jgi:hypothetical protein
MLNVARMLASHKAAPKEDVDALAEVACLPACNIQSAAVNQKFHLLAWKEAGDPTTCPVGGGGSGGAKCAGLFNNTAPNVSCRK